MPWSIASYNSTPSGNTTINGINIAEGCNASGINDAIRQMMADVAAYFGTAAAFAGTVAVSGAATLSSTLAVTSNATVGGTLIAQGDITCANGSIHSGNNVTAQGFGVKTTMDYSGANTAPMSGSGITTCNFTINANTGGGVVLTNNGTSWSAVSDYRAKTVFGDFEGSGGIVDAVPVYSASLNTAPNDVKAMFLAHEVQAAVPWAVMGEKDAIDAAGAPVFQLLASTDPLVAILWAEVRSLRARVTSLEARAA